MAILRGDTDTPLVDGWQASDTLRGDGYTLEEAQEHLRTLARSAEVR